MGLSRDELVELSVALQQVGLGGDSIPTVQSHYLRDEESGTYECCYSSASTMGQHDCRFRRRDPVAMWRHVHFTGHGLTWADCRTPEQAKAALEAGTIREVRR